MTQKKNSTEIIPHYVGGSTLPKFPVDESYGRAMLLIHQPWSENDPLIGEGRWTELFEEFLQTDHCPSSVKIACERARQRSEKIKAGAYIEPISGLDDFEPGDLYGEPSEEACDIIELLSARMHNMPTNMFQNLNCSKGEDYDWSK